LELSFWALACEDEVVILGPDVKFAGSNTAMSKD